MLITYSIFGSNKKRKKRTLVLTLIIILFFSNQFIFEEFMRKLEVEPVKIDSVKTYDYGILLGGLVFYDSTNKQIVPINRAVDRMLKTIELYKKGKIRKIFISAGSGSLVYEEFIEADIVRKYLLDIGIPDEDILCERKSRNTHENAVYTKELLNDEINAGKDFLIITSSFHMRRSLACFQKTGMKVDGFPVGRYSGPRRYHFDHIVMPNINTFAEWTIIIKEFVGYLVYDIVGYI